MTTKTLMALTIALFGLGSLTACNTTAGLGQDVENTGEYIEEKAEEAS